ncbi:MAG: anthranilate phosphoribosyltransferase, partial [Candidatus Geothermincolia bacterium]
GGDAATNASIIKSVLAGEEGPCLEVTVANAAFAIVAGGKAASMEDGVREARRSVASGEAGAVLDRLARFSAETGERER